MPLAYGDMRTKVAEDGGSIIKSVPPYSSVEKPDNIPDQIPEDVEQGACVASAPLHAHRQKTQYNRDCCEDYKCCVVHVAEMKSIGHKYQTSSYISLAYRSFISCGLFVLVDKRRTHKRRKRLDPFPPFVVRNRMPRGCT